MSIATEIARLTQAKADIKAAIELKGVPVGANDSLDLYDTHIANIPTGSTGWQPPSDWIDISNVANGEINILTSDLGCSRLTFRVEMVGGADRYSVDWGDGVVETDIEHSEHATHAYVPGSGQACSLGYTTFKVRIYGASSEIRKFSLVPYNSVPSFREMSPILSIVFGTTTLTSLQNSFYNPSNILEAAHLESVIFPPSMNNCSTMESAFADCKNLQNVVFPESMTALTSSGAKTLFKDCASLSSVELPLYVGSVTNADYIFQNCYSLKNIEFPASWSSLNSLQYSFYFCLTLESAKFPSAMSNLTTMGHCFNGCRSLREVVLPTALPYLSNMGSTFRDCLALKSITLPANMSGMTGAASCFYNCTSLKTINNLETFGATTPVIGFAASGFMTGLFLVESISMGAAINQISFDHLKSLTSLRLTNSTSTFGWGYPQISLSNCAMSAEALNTLFGDLPTVAGKSIIITFNPGAATCDTTIATSKGWTVVR